jgi:hypothetical protein
MGATGQIFEDLFWPAERWFGVDHPLDVFQRAQQSVKPGSPSKRNQVSMKLQLPAAKGIPQES